jgi:hypothetical protein
VTMVVVEASLALPQLRPRSTAKHTTRMRTARHTFMSNLPLMIITLLVMKEFPTSKTIYAKSVGKVHSGVELNEVLFTYPISNNKHLLVRSHQ